MAENRDKIINLIEATIHPDRMTKRQALDFMDELIDELESQRQALRDEIEGEEEEGNASD